MEVMQHLVKVSKLELNVSTDLASGVKQRKVMCKSLNKTSGQCWRTFCFSQIKNFSNQRNYLNLKEYCELMSAANSEIFNCGTLDKYFNCGAVFVVYLLDRRTSESVSEYINNRLLVTWHQHCTVRTREQIWLSCVQVALEQKRGDEVWAIHQFSLRKGKGCPYDLTLA